MDLVHSMVTGPYVFGITQSVLQLNEFIDIHRQIFLETYE